MGRGVRAVVGGEKAAERNLTAGRATSLSSSAPTQICLGCLVGHRGFAILYSVGNLIALMGTFFLAGPMRLQSSTCCDRVGFTTGW